MKKILFVNSSLSGGGSEKVMTLLANQMAMDGYDVVMLLCIHKNEVYELNNEVRRCYLTENNTTALMRKYVRLAELRKHFKKERPDIIISFMSQINMYSLVASIGLRIPVIVSERADPMQRRKIQQIAEKVLYTLFANHVVFQTEFVRNYFNRLIRKKSSVILNPINEQELPLYSGIRENKIVGIGRMTNQKNFRLLIDAFADFVKICKNYELHIYGDGELRENLESMVKKNFLSEKVFFHGYVDNIVEQIYKYKMYVSTSNFEGISNAMLETMAMGIPVICTDCPVGGARMIIEDSVNGILIPMNDKKALVDAMLKIVEDVVHAEKMAEEGIKIRRNLNLRFIAKQWEDLIREKV